MEWNIHKVHKLMKHYAMSCRFISLKVSFQLHEKVTDVFCTTINFTSLLLWVWPRILVDRSRVIPPDSMTLLSPQ